MKLRFAENSIRIRIRKSELEELERSKQIEQTISFGLESVLQYSLVINADIDEVTATFTSGVISVMLPPSVASEWYGTNQVSIIHDQVIEEGAFLHILVEKDFPCLDREEEDKSDTFWELAPEVPDNC